MKTYRVEGFTPPDPGDLKPARLVDGALELKVAR